MATKSKARETRNYGVNQKRNTVTFSISLEGPLYEVLEGARPKTGPNRYRSTEIATALEFYYAFQGKLPAGYRPENTDPTVIASAKLAAAALKRATRK